MATKYSKAKAKRDTKIVEQAKAVVATLLPTEPELEKQMRDIWATVHREIKRAVESLDTPNKSYVLERRSYEARITFLKAFVDGKSLDECCKLSMKAGELI